ISIPLFKLPFDWNRAMIWPCAGHCQPDTDVAAGAGVEAGGCRLAAGALAAAVGVRAGEVAVGAVAAPVRGGVVAAAAGRVPEAGALRAGAGEGRLAVAVLRLPVFRLSR